MSDVDLLPREESSSAGSLPFARSSRRIHWIGDTVPRARGRNSKSPFLGKCSHIPAGKRHVVRYDFVRNAVSGKYDLHSIYDGRGRFVRKLLELDILGIVVSH